MRALARHDARFRSTYPTDRLLVVVKIDGPIIDQRRSTRRATGSARIATGSSASGGGRRNSPLTEANQGEWDVVDAVNAHELNHGRIWRTHEHVGGPPRGGGRRHATSVGRATA
jgi:hypothetical protein